MKVLCCLDGTNIEQLSKVVSTMLRADDLTIGLIYIIDPGPHEELARDRERFLRPPHLAPQRLDQIRQAEIETAQEILQEGGRYFPNAEYLRREGRPEREIVQCAAEWGAAIIVIIPPSPNTPIPPLAPNSLAHLPP